MTAEGKEGELKPVIKNVKISSLNNSLTVSCKVLRLGTEGITYSYSITEESGYIKVAEGTTEESCEITGLILGERYYIKIEASNENGTVEETRSVILTKLVEEINLSKTEITIDVGSTETITATVSPSNASNTGITWTTSNESVATVSNGIITAVSVGTATITCTAEDGSGVSNTCVVTVVKPMPIADVISVGDYINYTPTSQSYTMTTTQTGYTIDQTYSTSSYTGGWKVLYNDEEHGVQLISNDVVGSLCLQGENGYNNLVGTLNTMAGKYVNTTYAVSGRSVGSSPSDRQTSTGTAELYTNTTYTYMTTYGWNNKYKVADTNYTTDETAMTTAGVKTLSTTYWLASRFILADSGGTYFYGHCIIMSGSVDTSCLWGVYWNGSSDMVRPSRGVRPVITLKSDILIDTSDTTKDGTSVTNAWILK